MTYLAMASLMLSPSAFAMGGGTTFVQCGGVEGVSVREALGPGTLYLLQYSIIQMYKHDFTFPLRNLTVAFGHRPNVTCSPAI